MTKNIKFTTLKSEFTYHFLRYINFSLNQQFFLSRLYEDLPGLLAEV